MKIKTIAVDLDNCLSCMTEEWLAIYNIRYGDDLTVDDITDWDVFQFTTKCTKRQLKDILGEPAFFLRPDPKPFSIEVMEWLCSKFKVFIVTAYKPDSCADKCHWLAIHYPFLDPDNIIFCNDKSLIAASIMIDDGSHNLNRFGGFPILFDAPHNRNIGGFRRAHNWLEVKEIINELAK